MTPKRALFILIFIALISAVVFQSVKLKNLPTKAKIEIDNSEMPFFELETTNGLIFTKYDFPSNKPVVFMYMDPSCKDCETFINKIKKYYTEFENVQLYMITEADVTQMATFWESNNLAMYSNIQALLDKNEIMFRKFQLFSTPSFVIYNSELERVKVLDENFNFSILIKYVREANKKKSKNKL